MTNRKLAKTNTGAPLAQRHVCLSNALARAAHGLSLAEKRVIAAGIATIDQTSAHAANAAFMYGFSVKIAAADYAETYGINARTAYDELKYVAKTLIKRQWTVVDGRTTAHYNWLSGVKYHDGQGWMEMHYTHWISPHLYFLRKQFTTYRLEQAAALRSAYSWRLFECLMSWRDTGKWSPSLDDFYRAMDIKKDSPYRKNFAHLRRRVLDPSLRELRDKDGWDVTCEFVKGGRRVVGLSFKFSPARQGRLDF